MPYPSSAKLFPDLQKYFRQYMIDNKLSRYEIQIPGEIYDNFFTECRSFIRLMFDNNWSFFNYTHCYTQITDYSAWPISIADRLMVYPHSAYYLPYNIYSETDIYLEYSIENINLINSINHNEIVCENFENSFNLISDDFLLLDALNIYRCDSTALIILEQVEASNTLSKLPDQNIWLLNLSYNSLTSNISKLIFLFLNLKINLDYTFFTWTGTNYISDNLFEYLYELYVIDNIFQYMISIGPDYIET